MKYLRRFTALFLLVTSLIGLGCKEKRSASGSEKTKPVVIGYVGGFKGLVETENIDATKLTHINYAFVDIKDGKAFLTNENTDSTNFRMLNGLKKANPELKILISIGGWAWSEHFSDAVLTGSSRKIFAKSAVDIIRTYKLDGVDIDWEYPGMPGEEGNVYRPEDKQNFTLMFQEIRKELDLLEEESGTKKLLTTAVAGFAEFLEHSEMDKAAKFLDYVNLMTYDLFVDGISVNHAGLYESKAYKSDRNADNCVKAFVKAGVPVEKLVLGLPFYGRSFTVDKGLQMPVGQRFTDKAYIDGYSYIKDSLVNKKGFKEFRDTDAQVPYIYNSSTGVMISYDDEVSVSAKCKYVLDHKMGGVMFWESTSDPKEYLLNSINQAFKSE